MCKDYCTNSKDEKFINDLILYYKSLERSKYINIHLIKYFKYLSGKNMLKKTIKEIISFHFPVIGYIIYKSL